MNCIYYIVFEQNYKKYQFQRNWWKEKKIRIDKTIKDFNSNNPTLIARAQAQTKVISSQSMKNHRIYF